MLLIVAAIVLFACISGIGYNIKNKLNRIFMSGSHSISLTQDEMLSDFEEMFDIFTENEYAYATGNDLCNIDFKEKENIYRNRLSKAENELEFFYCLQAVSADIQSCHTTLAFPDSQLYSNYANATAVLSDSTVHKYIDDWENLMYDFIDSYEPGPVWFDYCDGKYVILRNSDNVIFELESIDENNPDTFIKEELSAYKIKYDFVNQKAYRDSIVLDKNDGERKISLVMIGNNGERLEMEAFISYEAELWSYYASSIDDRAGSYVYNDSQNNVSYVYVDSMIGDSSNLTAEIAGIPNEIENIIIDIRNNTGGLPEFANDILYEPLFTENSFAEGTIKIQKGTEGEKFYSSYLKINPIANTFLRSENSSELLFSTNTMYIGNASVKRDIYVLTANNTMSAADNFAAAVKNSGTAVIVGENSGGEGLTIPPYITALNNSGLCLIVTASSAVNSQETDNVAYGTAPDIYSSHTIEGFGLKQQLIANGKNPYTYENRLKWDNVLIETLEIIKEKGNVK